MSSLWPKMEPIDKKGIEYLKEEGYELKMGSGITEDILIEEGFFAFCLWKVILFDGTTGIGYMKFQQYGKDNVN